MAPSGKALFLFCFCPQLRLRTSVCLFSPSPLLLVTTACAPKKKKNARQDARKHARGEPRFVRKFFKAWLVPTVRPPETPFQTLAVRIGIRYMVSSPNSHEHGVAWRRDNNHDGGSDGTDG